MIKHEKHFKLLEKIAMANEPVSRARLAAILVYRNEVLGVGYNKHKTHPFQKRFAKHELAISLHAEIDALINARKMYSDDIIAKSTMYVLRIKRPDEDSKDFIRGMAKPCKGCQRALTVFNIRKVYYTTEEGFDFL